MEDNNLPRVRDVPTENRQEMFMAKVDLCLDLCLDAFDLKPFIVDFKSRKSLYDLRESGVVTGPRLETINNICQRDDMLRELSDDVLSLESLSDEAVRKIMKMLRANIYRPFPSGTAVVSKQENDDFYDTGEKRPLVEGAWIHLRCAYEFLRTIVDAGLLRDDHIEDAFITGLFNIAVQADDSREACFVAEFLPSFWAKFPKKQRVIWCTVRSNLCRYLSDRQSCIPSAIGNLLQFVSDRIPEWKMPLEEEHRHLLRLVLIPMHKIKAYPYFSGWLQLCLVGFLQKNTSLVNPILEGILTGDPTPSTSEWHLLDELKSLMKFSNIEEISKSNAQLLFRRIAKDLRDSKVKVIKKGLDLASFASFIELVKIDKEMSLPIMTRGLEGAIQGNEKTSVPLLAKRIIKKYYTFS